MKGLRAIKSVRLLLAAIALAGSVGSSPVIGHAHGPILDTSHHHHGWADHDHSPPHAEEGDDHDATPRVGESVFHLHGAWFGIPFSLPTAAPRGTQGERIDYHPGADACLVQASASDVVHPRWEPPLSSPESWLLYPLCAPSGQPSPFMSLPSETTSTSGVLLMRSVLLRC